VQDRDAAKTLLETVKGHLPRLLVVWADGAYAAVAAWVASVCHFVLTTILRPLGIRGFVVLPKRWIVERTFAWLGRLPAIKQGLRNQSPQQRGLDSTGDDRPHEPPDVTLLGRF